MSDQRLTGDQISELDLPDWRAMFATLEGRFRTGDFATGLDFTNRIGAAAEAADHHPEIELGYDHVGIVLISHDVGGKTQRDVELAREISRIAAELGLVAEPEQIQRLEIGLDTWQIAEIRPFWVAVLGLDAADGAADEVRDASRRLPALWFQSTDRHAEPRQRFHYDLWVPPEVAQQRIEAALAAGGSWVSAEAAPRFWVLADPQGNKICICTQIGRDY